MYWMRLWKTYRNGQVVTASKLGDLASVSERGTHNDGVVTKLLVVVEDLLDRLDTGVLLLGVLLLGGGLEPVKNTTNEGRDEVGAGLSSADGLDHREHEGKVGVDTVVALKDLGGLDTLPGSSDLDQNAVLGDTLLAVKLLIRVSTGTLEVVRLLWLLTSIRWRALLTEASVSKE
jgi:hypothetical protein